MFWFIVGAGLALCLLGITHAYSFSLSVGGANKVLTTWESDQPLEVNYDDTLAIGADVAIGIALDISQIQALVIVASTAATIETNSTGAPQETLVLVAGVPLIWHASQPGSAIGDIFAGDVTEMYVTNVAATRLQIYTSQAS